ncbi:MAG: polyphosphate kinase 1 [Chloroflexi bacterium]|nr:MAG: polyphosphate kinase 1 [Chloroflexota bacterium]
MQSDILNSLPELTPENFTNRELSWLEFNRRVLAQAQDERLPLLERLKFLAIFSDNLDEFYMVRVASIRNKMDLGISNPRADGLTPSQTLSIIRERVLDMMTHFTETLRDVLTQLEHHDVCLRRMSQLSNTQRRAIRAYFQEEIFPVLTPLGVDHARPFPFISNLSLNIAVWLQRNDGVPGSDIEFVRIKVPERDALPRFINLCEVLRNYGGADETYNSPYKYHFVWLEDAIADNLDLLFPGMTVIEQHPFRVTRNADIDYENEREEDLLDISAIIEESLFDRRFGPVVRLTVLNDISDHTLNRLIDELKVEPIRDVYKIDEALDTSDLFELTNIDRPDLKHPPYIPRVFEIKPYHRDIFAAIRQNDILLHHPYDSFSPVEEFFRIAATDPNVLAIKATLYRVGQNSPIVQALLEARNNDKQVAVLVELKARFDEKNNLGWARELDASGVHVIYGVEELPVKTHAKIALVVRRDPDGVRRYVHLGTGNYNAITARLYTDIGLLTCNDELAEDASRLFNRLTGYAPSTHYRRLLVAPEYLLDNLIDLIDNEILAAQEGKTARLIFKMNQLEEDRTIQKLYQASQAGVQIDLLVRGLSCLRPGLTGFSENIRVHSIVGRFLEHSRIFYFHNAPPDRRVYLGSADLMRRNLYNRVEVVFPVLDPRIQEQVLRILMTGMRDNQQAWVLQPDGKYTRIERDDDEEIVDSQAIFMRDSAGLTDV